MTVPLPSGLGHHNISSRPVEVGGDLTGVEVQQISTYGDCSLAVSREGQLYGWGNSEYLQLASVTEATQVRRVEQLTHTWHVQDGSVGLNLHLSVSCPRCAAVLHSWCLNIRSSNLVPCSLCSVRFVRCSCLLVFVLQISSPRLLPLKGCGKVVQAACGGTQVAILNGQFSQHTQHQSDVNVFNLQSCVDLWAALSSL